MTVLKPLKAIPLDQMEVKRWFLLQWSMWFDLLINMKMSKHPHYFAIFTIIWFSDQSKECQRLPITLQFFANYPFHEKLSIFWLITKYFFVIFGMDNSATLSLASV